MLESKVEALREKIKELHNQASVKVENIEEISHIIDEMIEKLKRSS